MVRANLVNDSEPVRLVVRRHPTETSHSFYDFEKRFSLPLLKRLFVNLTGLRKSIIASSTLYAAILQRTHESSIVPNKREEESNREPAIY